MFPTCHCPCHPHVFLKKALGQQLLTRSPAAPWWCAFLATGWWLSSSMACPQRCVPLSSLVSPHQHTRSSSRTGSETARLCIPRESDIGQERGYIQSKMCTSENKGYAEPPQSTIPQRLLLGGRKTDNKRTSGIRQTSQPNLAAPRPPNSPVSQTY